MKKAKSNPSQKVRTKGNTKPSSSDRSSEFLQRNALIGADTVPRFSLLSLHSNTESSIGSHSIAGGFSSLLPLDQDPLADALDADFLASLRRLEKRSSATKQKALDTLVGLLRDQDANGAYIKSEDIIVVSVLPFWPRLYNGLVYDEDRRVRELSQVVMHVLAKRLGRKLSPCLKDIVVSWTFATVDFYENTAKAAQTGLDDTFPGQRRGDLYRIYAKYLLDECERRIAYLSTEFLNHVKVKKNKSLDDPIPPAAHYHLHITAQFLSWISSFLPELGKLPKDSVQLTRLHDILLRLWPTVSPIVDMIDFPPLHAAYFCLISVMCKCMTEWVAGQEELLDFVIFKCVKVVDACPERLVATSTCLMVFGEKIWSKISWMDLINHTIIPMIEQAQTKAQRQAVYTNLLPLVSQFPLEQINDEAGELLKRLLNISREGLLCSLGLPVNSDIRGSVKFNIVDHGSSVDCVVGVLELSRYLLDRAVLVDNEELVDFLLGRVFFDLLCFVLSYSDTSKRWVYYGQFSSRLFEQICATLVHLSHDSRPKLQTAFTSLKEGITKLLRSTPLRMCPLPLDPLLDFFHHLVRFGTDSTGIVQSWCQRWLCDTLCFIRPTSEDEEGFARRWLLSFDLIGYIDSFDGLENALDLLITSIIPAFDDEVFKWIPSMSKGLAKFSLKPITLKSWTSASMKTRKNFVNGPMKNLFSYAKPEEFIPILESLITLLIQGIDTESNLLLDLSTFIFTTSCTYNEVREHTLESVCFEISRRSYNSPELYGFLSLFIDLLISQRTLSLGGLFDLVKQYVRLSLDALWSTKHSHDVSPKTGDRLSGFLKTVEDSDAGLFSHQIWVDVLAKLKLDGCPSDSVALLAFLGQLRIDTITWSETWLSHIVLATSNLSDEVELVCENLPIFVRSEVFPIHFLPRLAPIVVAVQTGLKLSLHTALIAGSPAHKQLANSLLMLRFWFSAGIAESYTLADLSLQTLFMPTNAEALPSVSNLLSYFEGICSEIADSVYSPKELDTSNVSLRASLAKRLVDIHPLEWPLSFRQAASCSPPSWLEEQVTGSSPDEFLLLCEVCLPLGVLRRCLPRSGAITNILNLASKEYLEGNREGLPRLAELIASLSSTAFIGGSYAITLAPIILEEVVRDSLTDFETCEDPKLLRAVVASMKALQLLILLRQPARQSEILPHLGLAALSLRLRRLKPRLTREQWDSLLCLTASWITQAAARPVRPTAFVVRAFQLAAAVGALFVNSLCTSTTVTSALIQRDTEKVTSVDQLMDMSREEWDETDFTFTEDYDCEDDGSMSPVDVRILEQFDDAADADTEESSFEDPNVHRRLPPPASVQKDWREFFSANLYGSLISLTVDMCLCGVDSNNYMSKDTPPHIAALCAAVATCSVETLLVCLEDQPDIVVNYLLDSPAYQSCHPPQVENNLFSSKCLLAPNMRNTLDLIVRFLDTSPYQTGQLLGHILLTRLVASRSLEPIRRMSDILIPHLPVTWVSALTAPLTEELESILSDTDTVVSQWGRGAFTVNQLVGEDMLRGHQRLLAYLLAWDAIISLMSSASQQSRAGLQAALLKDEMWIGHLCRLLFTLGLLLPTPNEIRPLLVIPSRLEPDIRLLLTSSSRAAVCNATGFSPLKVKSVFAPVDALVQLAGHRLTEDLSHLAVRLLNRLLSESPALMRSLYAEMQRGALVGERITAGQSRQLASHLERVVRCQFSAHLIAAEVESIERRAGEFKSRLGTTPYLDAGLPDAGSVDIRGRPLSRQIVTTYHFSTDQSLEMIITLPENFPLSSVTVETGDKIGASMSNWRNWIVHLSVFINNQNGSILDGIGLWLRNLKKRFDGVEDCAICYSVIHDRNFSFPRMQCRVCKKRYHNDCMYRYFQTSRNPTCPVCRSLFYTTS